MAYREDPDLVFLQSLFDNDLNDLVHLLIYDKDGKKRYAESLSNKAVYKKHAPKHTLYWKEIAEEVQCFGANGIVTNLFRGGKGVLYKEVLSDACGKLGVKFNEKSSVSDIEDSLLLKTLRDTFEKMSEKEINELAQNLGVKNREFISPEILLGSFQAVFLAGGFKSYQLTLIVANAISKALLGRGFTLAGNVLLTRTAGLLTGPIGWTITGLWTAVDLAGPAYRVTIPAVIQIAALRKKQQLTQQDLERDLEEALEL